LIADLQRELGMSVLLITHDLGVVAEVCQEVAVLYAGQIVERASTADLFRAPRHPYSAGLLRSMPPPGARAERLDEIPGIGPDLRKPPPGCRFQDRCPRVRDRCRAEPVPLDQVEPGRLARCFFPEGLS